MDGELEQTFSSSLQQYDTHKNLSIYLSMKIANTFKEKISLMINFQEQGKEAN